MSNQKKLEATVGRFLKTGENIPEDLVDMTNLDSYALLKKASNEDIVILNSHRKLPVSRVRFLAEVMGLSEIEAKIALQYFYNWQVALSGGGVKVRRTSEGGLEVEINEGGR